MLMATTTPYNSSPIAPDASPTVATMIPISAPGTISTATMAAERAPINQDAPPQPMSFPAIARELTLPTSAGEAGVGENGGVHPSPGDPEEERNQELIDGVHLFLELSTEGSLR